MLALRTMHDDYKNHQSAEERQMDDIKNDKVDNGTDLTDRKQKVMPQLGL
jgi:hypothetical protein